MRGKLKDESGVVVESGQHFSLAARGGGRAEETVEVGPAFHDCLTPFIQDSSLVGSLLEELFDGILPQSEEGELSSRELAKAVLDDRVSMDVEEVVACKVPSQSDE